MFDANLSPIWVNAFEIKLMAVDIKLSAWQNCRKIIHQSAFQE